MSLLRYFQSKTPLPTVHQTAIGDRATSEANRQVERVVGERQSRKRKRYTTYRDEDRAQIGRYAAENGNTKAVKRFKADLPDLSESTERSFKPKYMTKVQERRKENDFTTVTTIESKKRGRPLTLGELDSDVQSYIRGLRRAGTPLSLPVIVAGATGIVIAKDRSLLAENGGHISLTPAWARSLLVRMGMVKRKASTSKSAKTPGELQLQR